MDFISVYYYTDDTTMGIRVRGCSRNLSTINFISIGIAYGHERSQLGTKSNLAL